MISQVADLLRVLPRSLRSRAIGGLALAVAAGMLELMSLGLVIPVVSLVLHGGLSSGTFNGLVAWADRDTGINAAHWLPLGMAALLLAFTAKALVMAWLAERQAALGFLAYERISSQLFSAYLGRPWAFHVQRNSAQLLRNLTGEIQQVTQGLLALQAGVADAAVLLAIVGLLSWVEPLGTVLALGVVGGAGWMYQRLMHGRLGHWGELRHGYEGKRIQSAQQALAAIKEIRVLGREGHFAEDFDRHTQQAGWAGRRRAFAQQLPRVVMEWFGLLGLVLVVLALGMRGLPPAKIIATTALFAVSAFRLMPILSRMLHGVQTLQFGEAAVKAVAADLEGVRDEPAGELPCPPLTSGIHLQSVCCRHPDSARPALDQVSLFIPAGSVVGVIGDSGAGKSTLVDVLLGLVPPDSGRMLVDGAELFGRERAWQRQIGYVPQHIVLVDDSIRRNIAFGLPDGDIDPDALRRAVDAAQLASFVDRLPRGLDTNIGEAGVKLSGGERQRIGLARALYRDPGLLVLDEASSALDIGTEARVIDAVLALRGKKTIVLVSHRLATVARCDLLFRLEKGELVPAGAPSGVLA